MPDVQRSVAVGFGKLIVVSNPQPPLEKGCTQFTVADLFTKAAARDAVGAEIARLNGRSCRAREELAEMVVEWLGEKSNQQLLVTILPDSVRATVIDNVVSMATGGCSESDTALARVAAQINQREALDASDQA